MQHKMQHKKEKVPIKSALFGADNGIRTRDLVLTKRFFNFLYLLVNRNKQLVYAVFRLIAFGNSK